MASATEGSATTYAKAKAAQAQGLSAGIGTIIGAIFGGPLGAAVGGSIGGGDAAGVARAFASDLDTDWSDAFSRGASNKAKTKMGDGDIMQLASAYNMIDENGSVKPSFLELLQNIGA